jgi:hypothetical protein
MAEGVATARRNHGKLWRNGLEKFLGMGSRAAVMANLQKIRLRIPSFQDLFGPPMGIANQKRRGVVIWKTQHHGLLVLRRITAFSSWVRIKNADLHTPRNEPLAGDMRL